MNVAVFDCYSGISGDMTLGAFLDAGLDFKLLQSEIKKLRLSGVRLAVKKVKRGGFSGTKFDVRIPEQKHSSHTNFFHVRKLIQNSRLHPGVRKLALEMFQKLASAEAKVRGTKPAKVFFHEVGTLDSIVDIVGTAAAVHHLKIEKIFVRNLHVGFGEIRTYHHGRVMLPSPGALELLKGFKLNHAPIRFEMVTPAGAAILAALAEKTDEIPDLDVQSVGYGAGSQDFKDRPNLLRITLGQSSRGFKKDRILVLETNLDDMNPLGFEILYTRLFQAGALDVYLTPVLMKKMRPAHKLSVLLEHSLKEKISEVVFKETTTFGLRFMELDRFLLARKITHVQTKFGRVSVKIGTANGRPHIASPEYEDCKKISLTRRIPFGEVYREAKKQASRLIS